MQQYDRNYRKVKEEADGYRREVERLKELGTGRTAGTGGTGGKGSMISNQSNGRSTGSKGVSLESIDLS